MRRPWGRISQACSRKWRRKGQERGRAHRLGPVRQLGCEGSAGEDEGDEAKRELVSGQSTQKDQEPLAERREVCPWEDTTLTVWAGR